MAQPKLKTAILVISDTASRDASTDKVGSTLSQTLEVDGGDKWEIPFTQIVPDDSQRIQNTIIEWTDDEDQFNLILTAGGTGFAVKDITPEVSL